MSDERDVVRLRTNYRTGEDVYLYHLNMDSVRARARFLEYIDRLTGLPTGRTRQNDLGIFETLPFHSCESDSHRFCALTMPEAGISGLREDRLCSKNVLRLLLLLSEACLSLRL